MEGSTTAHEGSKVEEENETLATPSLEAEKGM